MIIGNNQKYINTPFNNEEELENVVFDNFELIFGSFSLLLPKKKLSTVGGFGTIPDGIIIDFQGKEWFLLEAELASHSTWHHIAPQVSKQITAVENNIKNVELLSKVALEVISENDDFKNKLLDEFDIKEIDIHTEINIILNKQPSVAIPIDDIPADLNDWASTLKNTVKIWKIEKYISEHDDSTLFSIPDDAIPSLATTIKTEGDNIVRERTAQPKELYRKIIEEGLINVGEELYMDYGMRGQERNRYSGIVQSGGIEFEGRVYSPSYAAVSAMRKAGSDRPTANGWIRWKNKDGETLDTISKKINENKE